MKEQFNLSVSFMVYVLIAFFVTGIGVYALWNWLMPSIFNLREITFYESLGLNFLSKMLFQSFEFSVDRDEEND